jgi:hypothetical protein
MEAVMKRGSEALPGSPAPAPLSRPDGQRGGFTVLELAIALTILSAGSAVLWYGLKSSAKQERSNRLHHAAIIAARSDLESLRSIPKQDIHDTLYLSSGGSGESLLVVRTVMDSSRIVNSLDEVVLDDKLSPKEAKKPLEVKVAVYRLPASESGPPLDASSFKDPETDESPSSGDGEDRKPRKLVGFLLKLPEYKWY